MTGMQRGVFPFGSRVRLKSGGPEMLVVDLDNDRETRIVAWKTGNAVSEQEFKVSTLTEVEKAAP